MKKLRPKSGFTLVELLIYISLVSIFVSGAISFMLNVLSTREKVYQQQTVEQNARAAIARIAYEIRRANNIQGISSDELTLNNESSNTKISLISGRIQITTGGTGPYYLTSNQINVLSPPDAPKPLFTNLSTTNKNSKNILVSVTASNIPSFYGTRYKALITSNQSTEINGQFNAARMLLMNASGALLSNDNRQITNTTLQNSGSTDITISNITISWTGGVAASRLTSVTINGSNAWTGSAASGTAIPINNGIIRASNPAVSIIFNFNNSMAGAVFNIIYTMTDSSTKNTTISFN